jgi:transcriptional regulator with XRE-family HTH domain
VNERLRHALAEARKTEVDVSSALGVDPKTVHRWLRGRVPLRQYRWALADLLERGEDELWLESEHGGCPEIQTVYPHRGAVPRDVWRKLFESATHDVGILVYAGLFLAEDVDLLRMVADRARAGVAVRVLLGDPDCAEVA